MADRFAGKISIGGQVPADKVQALIDAINSESINLHPEWSDKTFSANCKQDLMDALDKSGHIVLCDDQATNGMFDCLEAELTEIGVAWERWSDGYCEYDAEIVWWQPGMDAQEGVICDANGNEVVPAEPVKKAYALLRHCFSDRPGNENPEMRDAAMKQLASVVTEVPTLPPLDLEG